MYGLVRKLRREIGQVAVTLESWSMGRRHLTAFELNEQQRGLLIRNQKLYEDIKEGIQSSSFGHAGQLVG